jgi:tetratricopeptide (TPR) repeat protein
MHPMMKFAVPLIALLLSACSHIPKEDSNGQPLLSHSEAQTRYQQGLVKYRESSFDDALAELGAALASGQLKSEDAINARKHMAFIHCASGRELSCREQFQAILKAEPGFQLAPNETSHPTWGAVWRSLKGAMEEKQAVQQANSITASPAQQKLAEGIKEYDVGRYKEALNALQTAIKNGLPRPAGEIRARKYSAFSYCLTRRTTQCRGEFRKIFAIEPTFELLPSESGHPAWASAYRDEKKAAAKRAPKKK